MSGGSAHDEGWRRIARDPHLRATLVTMLAKLLHRPVEDAREARRAPTTEGETR